MATAKKGAKTTKASSKGSKTNIKNSPIMRRAKSVERMSILESVIIGVLGVMLIINPNWFIQVTFYIVGIFLMVKGVYKIVNYFAVKGRYDFYNNDLLYGIIALVFGLMAVILWEQLRGFIGIVVGAWMIYGALVRLNTSMKLQSAGVKNWFYVLLLSLVMLALGIYLIISTGVGVVQVLGWVMLAGAIIGIINDAVFMRHLEIVMK